MRDYERTAILNIEKISLGLSVNVAKDVNVEAKIQLFNV